MDKQTMRAIELLNEELLEELIKNNFERVIEIQHEIKELKEVNR